MDFKIYSHIIYIYIYINYINYINIIYFVVWRFQPRQHRLGFLGRGSGSTTTWSPGVIATSQCLGVEARVGSWADGNLQICKIDMAFWIF